MNERIKELMKQAGTDCSGKWMGVDHTEKLTEMIVRECADICGSQADRRNILKLFDLPVESNIKYPAVKPNNSVESQYERKYNLPK